MNDELMCMIEHAYLCKKKSCPVRTYLRFQLQMGFLAHLLENPEQFAKLLKERDTL